ncbi:uncharacterized protein tmem70 isoform X4 [Gadus morhua]|uniref:uncharacterized protein tmem70 isoform X4 n=1 Tax=Gadus morhua TaxID=8049 RepID=UPI0011B82F28|nr:transmembrane protein 70, mitochondrial isoform X4 [Gadus morhua]
MNAGKRARGFKLSIGSSNSTMASFIVFRGRRRLSLQVDDMTVEKIAMIFQVHPHSLYFTDDSIRGILPGPEGAFSLTDLKDGGHYEVHGESTADEGSQGQNPAARFAFRRPSSSALPVASGALPAPRAVGPKLNTRNVFIAELVDGRPVTRKTVAVRFSEFEASVNSISVKVVEALGDDEPIVLVDSHANEILDCEGNRGSAFWKQHARKIFAVPQDQMQRTGGGGRIIKEGEKVKLSVINCIPKST